MSERDLFPEENKALLAFVRLLAEGGTIVSSNDCSPLEIAIARSHGRFWVDPTTAYGYVWQPPVP